MRGARGALALAAGTLLGLALASPAAALGPVAASGGQDVEISVTVPELGTGVRVVDDAELLWGLNAETGARSPFGGCNFLMAGRPGATGDAGGSHVWTAADNLYRPVDGPVRVAVPDGTAQGRTATWDTRCRTPQGDTVTGDEVSQARVVVDGGVGVADLDAGTVAIDWTGTFTVVYYGGLTYWWASDPQLRVAGDGTGTLTASVGGYAADRVDTSRWVPLEPRRVVLADLRLQDGQLTASGIVTDPLYLGVDAAAYGQVPRTADNADHWGAFPASFLEVHRSTGQDGYWHTSGGAADRRKVASQVTVRFRAGQTDGAEVLAPSASASASVEQPTQPAAAARAPRAAGALGASAPALAPTPVFAVPAALTFSGPRAALVDPGTARVRDQTRAAVGLAGVLLGTAGAVVGFRRGWLVLPGRGKDLAA